MIFLPGWFYLIAVALASEALSTLVTVGGKHPLESSVLAIIFGIILRAINAIPNKCQAGVKTSEKILIFGIVLLGAGFDVKLVASQGWSIAAIVLITMSCGFFLILLLGRFLKLTSSMTMLLAAGTTICGTSAIAVTAPLIKAKEEETSYAIGTVALLGLIATILYPMLGHMFGASDLAFGIFAGTAIHSTPQVVAAGIIYSEIAGKTATAVKLLRNCFMAPIAMLIAFLYRSPGETNNLTRAQLMRAFPWFLFGYFIMAGLSSYGVFSADLIASLTQVGKFLILIGMVGIGLNTNLSAFKSIGLKPLIAGTIAALIVALISVLGTRTFITV